MPPHSAQILASPHGGGGYLMTLGKESLPEVGENSVLNANYMMAKLGKTYDMAYPGSCMHEFVMTLEILHKKLAFRRWIYLRDC